jgi:hypothetical protein
MDPIISDFILTFSLCGGHSFNGGYFSNNLKYEHLVRNGLVKYFKAQGARKQAAVDPAPSTIVFEMQFGDALSMY